jgi:NADH-quinone oxidoreductase subunit G
MCDQGRLDFHFVNSEFRLTDPLLKKAGRHENAQWSETLQAIADAARGVKGEEIAIVASARFTNEELHYVRKLAVTLGTDNLDVVPRTGGADGYLRADDLNPNSLGVRHILGIQKPGSMLEGIRELLGRGRLKLVIALGEDLLKAGFEARELEKAGFFASLHILAHAAADYAHAVLPGSSYAEKDGSMINVTGRLQRLNKAVNSPGNARDTRIILRDLVAACGGDKGPDSAAEVFTRIAGEIACLKGQTYDGIGRLGVPVIETEEKVPILERENERRAKGLIVG